MAAVQTPVPMNGPTIEERRSDDYEEERLPPEILEAQQRIGLVQLISHMYRGPVADIPCIGHDP